MTNRLLMIRPARFGFNVETADSNAFQCRAEGLDSTTVARRGLAEFDQVVAKLRDNGIEVLVLDDSPDPVKTDAVFPNNWISTHSDGTIITWPMAVPSRRNEVRPDLVHEIEQQFVVNRWWKLHEEAPSGKYLEGTGSLVLDHEANIAWACRSPRTDESLVTEFCDEMGFDPLVFDAVDAAGKSVYHTNVMMAVFEEQVVICLDCIPDEAQRTQVRLKIADTGKQLIELAWPQVEAFAGNMLQIQDRNLQSCVAMSTTARQALKHHQLQSIESASRIIELEIPTLEMCGGGSVRCMMAENYLTPRGHQTRN